MELSAEELGDLLAKRGLHPETILRPWDGLAGVVVARVVEVRDHPDSDKLCLARVQTGSGQSDVVVGVRNMGPGDLVPYAAPGSHVPTLEEPLAERTIRGERSSGMLCSPRELGISQEHEGILVLSDSDLSPGADVRTALGLDDEVLDLEIEANRPDLLSVIGIAREIAGATGVQLSAPDVGVAESTSTTASLLSVDVAAPDACPRYLARAVIGVGSRATPIRIQARLSAAGMRPISAVVDATNYAMLELGQPLHAFDLAKLAGPGIVVRRAAEGERLVTLDGVERALDAGDLLICDAERPVAIAGVMGAASAEVSNDTVDVVLESAYFEPRGVLRTSRRLLLPTEAAIRFGRGTDPEGVGDAASRAARLMLEWSGGGSAPADPIDVGAPPARRSIDVRARRVGAVLGYGVAADEIAAGLASIGIDPEASGDVVRTQIPGFRPDLVLEVDLIEEVARLRGYDLLPATLPAIRQPGSEAATYRRRRRIREVLVRAGFRESASLSFASGDDLEIMGAREAVAVANPPSADEPFLRTSLVPNLARALARNADRGVRGAALFEVGHVFAPGEPVVERESVAVALWGEADEGLQAHPRSFDVLDAKGALDALLDGLLAPGLQLGEVPEGPFHPSRSATVEVAGEPVGVLAELHPRAAERMGIEGRVALATLDVDALVPHLSEGRSLRDVPRFPPVRRDLAFVVDAETAAGAVQKAVVEAGGPMLREAVLFDVFAGEGISEGKKSLAFSIDLRAADRTLTSEEAEPLVEAIVARVASDFGGELRTG